jgi:ribonuclease III
MRALASSCFVGAVSHVSTQRRPKGFEVRLGYQFTDRALLKRALTHSSWRTAAKKTGDHDNERLEFLGDRVLGLSIAELLTETFPGATEGDLARIFNHLVRGETCAEVARTIALGEQLLLSDSEAGSGGRDKVTILADACEAVLAAVFLEGGFEAARRVVRLHWSKRLETLPVEPVDAKSALQEWAQGQGFDLPKYKELSREGPDHAPHFTTEVRVGGRKAPLARTAQGDGASKRSAEQSAATALLIKEGVWKAAI